MGQPFSFGFADSVIADAAGISLRELHFDADSVCTAFDAIKPLAASLGVEPPRPRLAGFAYNHAAALGAQVTFPEDGEPNVVPLLKSSKDIDALKDPEDLLAAEIVQTRLALLRTLRKKRPDAAAGIGHPFEGPVTTAVLLMGHDFLTLPYDDPRRAHALLDFCTRSAVNFAKLLAHETGNPIHPGLIGVPDDFAGMFPPQVFAEFVVPYWDALYRGLGAASKRLHSELLRVEHLRFLKDLGISVYDPSADQYLTPELLREHCPCAFECRIQSWHIRDMDAGELSEMYRELAGFHPHVISFYMSALTEKPKISALLATARKLAQR
ncbi:MAG TPA: hypothetical protein ENN09_04790 [Planctomycetes bacterium]|mgnify:CR=1 FL=1|nr:hypothetical protein [Planctomycetota bacterium]